MLKNGNKHLKNIDSNGRRVNLAWYSPFKKNNKPFTGDDTTIITGMLKRFKKDPLSSVTNVVMFYNNFTNQFIQKVVI